MGGVTLSSQEEHLNALLRYLGATYYDTLHGEAAASDVAHAVASVEAEHASRQADQSPLPRSRQGRRTGRWLVRDVMRTDPVTVERDASAKEMAQLMSEHRVSAIPVITGVRKLAGVVFEADLLHSRAGSQRGPGTPGQGGDTAADLMTVQAPTIRPDAPLAAAARLMDKHQVRLLPVVSPENELLGVVSRRNLLSIFLRPDEEIAGEVRNVLCDLLLVDPDLVTIAAQDGTVTLSGQIASEESHRSAIRMAEEVDGVACVTDQLIVAAPVGNSGYRQ